MGPAISNRPSNAQTETLRKGRRASGVGGDCTVGIEGRCSQSTGVVSEGGERGRRRAGVADIGRGGERPEGEVKIKEKRDRIGKKKEEDLSKKRTRREKGRKRGWWWWQKRVEEYGVGSRGLCGWCVSRRLDWRQREKPKARKRQTQSPAGFAA
jgi:hypothetical protein